jgi:hypothetical protein
VHSALLFDAWFQAASKPVSLDWSVFTIGKTVRQLFVLILSERLLGVLDHLVAVGEELDARGVAELRGKR